MSHFIVFAFLIGVVAGLRSLTAPAVVSWAVRLGWLHPNISMLAFLGASATPWILSVLALGELIADKLPIAPSRKAPLGFIARLLTGAVCGAAIGSSAMGAVAGAAGAVAGTLGGYEARMRLVEAVGKDWPVALMEDTVAIGGALLLVHVS